MIYESKIDFNLRFWSQNIFDATFFFSTDNNRFVKIYIVIILKR